MRKTILASAPLLVTSALLLGTSGASAQVGTAPFCLATDVTYGGVPDCSFRTWAQCRASQPGVGTYCYMNIAAGYVFDTRDPSNPRVIIPKSLRKPPTRH